MTALPAGRTVRCGEKVFNFSFAAKTMEMIKGLGGAQSLAPYDGMLFDFGVEMDVIMTPRGLLFSVQAAFVAEDGTVLDIATLNPAYGHNISCPEKVRYVIEAPVGFFDKHKISVGHKFIF